MRHPLRLLPALALLLAPWAAESGLAASPASSGTAFARPLSVAPGAARAPESQVQIRFVRAWPAGAARAGAPVRYEVFQRLAPLLGVPGVIRSDAREPASSGAAESGSAGDGAGWEPIGSVTVESPASAPGELGKIGRAHV